MKRKLLVSRPVPRNQVVIDCDCGSRYAMEIYHYQIVRCTKCGKRWWALEPEFNKPLVAYAYPEPAAPVPA